jgi:hypothetical protein
MSSARQTSTRSRDSQSGMTKSRTPTKTHGSSTMYVANVYAIEEYVRDAPARCKFGHAGSAQREQGTRPTFAVVGAAILEEDGQRGGGVDDA